MVLIRRFVLSKIGVICFWSVAVQCTLFAIARGQRPKGTKLILRFHSAPVA